jgi:glycosyltransferase involved in cell wall biosynthesis
METYKKPIEIDRLSIQKKLSVRPGPILKKYNLRKNSYILFMGRFVPEKRIEWILRLSREMEYAPFVLSGGISHSESYTENLKSRTAGGNIIFTGFVFGKEKAELISNCAFLILPSELEGYPVVVLEAGEYGKHSLVSSLLKPEYSPSDPIVHFFRSDSYFSFSAETKRLFAAIGRRREPRITPTAR